jgi:hypothetical protein
MLEVDLIAEYLVENSYASTSPDAYKLIQCMSDSFLFSIVENIESDILTEMRREDKERVKRGELRVPTWTAKPKKRTEIQTIPPSHSGTGFRKHVIQKSEVPDFNTSDNLFIAGERLKQGMSPIPPESSNRTWSPDPSHLSSGIRHTNVRHAHGGGEPGVPAGRRRGISRRQRRREEESGNVIRPNADTSRGPRVTRPDPDPSTTSVGGIIRMLRSRDAQRTLSRTNPSSDPNKYPFTDPSPEQLINRVPKLNLPRPRRTVNPNTARKKLGAAKTGSQVLSALSALEKLARR